MKLVPGEFKRWAMLYKNFKCNSMKGEGQTICGVDKNRFFQLMLGMQNVPKKFCGQNRLLTKQNLFETGYI